MKAIEIIAYLREQNFTVKADGDFIELSPPERITDELIQRLRKHKPSILAELKREERRLKVLAMLSEKPDSQRTISSDLENDPDNVILTIAIRNAATFEMLIPKYKYDGLVLLEMLHSLDRTTESNH
jgi:hypothetical protein